MRGFCWGKGMREKLSSNGGKRQNCPIRLGRIMCMRGRAWAGGNDLSTKKTLK